MDIYAKQALEEYSNDATATRRGGQGKPFWNIDSTQFIYAPAFQFPRIQGSEKYVFTATDEQGKRYSFTADDSIAALTPIWRDISTGVVCLKVEAIHKSGQRYLCGARTFFKSAPFPGREDLPPKTTSYRESALNGLKFVLNDHITRNWLTGLPKHDYYHSVYSSKMTQATVRALVALAQREPEYAEEAMKMATNAADYLISITYGEDSPVAGLPPTYSFLNLDRQVVRSSAPVAEEREFTVMMIYPADVGRMYLQLEEQTQDEKYFKMAEKIAVYYLKHVQPNGSWHLLVSAKTGEPETKNYCISFGILDFIHQFYERTGDECWKELEENYFAFIEKNCLATYNWEGQFEDSKISDNYSNLSHYEADGMIRYIAKYYPDDKEKMAVAEELMRFVEDQFVVWGRFSPLNKDYNEQRDTWYSPAGLEQYHWHVPIDASTASIAKSFLCLYEVTKKRLYLEKAFALADTMTRMQDKETGKIPTHWMKEDGVNFVENFWMNCHVNATFLLDELAKYEKEA